MQAALPIGIACFQPLECIAPNGRYDFIARRLDGDDHAGGFDLGQWHNDSVDVDATGPGGRSRA